MRFWQSPHARVLPQPGARTLIMGILNATPDSFSDGGQLDSPQALIDRAGAMIAAGADVLDLGGESTRPGAPALGASEELDRVLPAIASLRRAWPTVPLSIDTYKPTVADAAIEAGADIINDIWGLATGMSAIDRDRLQAAPPAEPDTDSMSLPRPVSAMAEVAARRGCPVIAMHNRPNRDYRDFWPDVLADLRMSVALAAAAGVPAHQLWLDPGFGFAKSPAQNLALIRDLHRIVALGFPVLVGTSRKSTLGLVLGTGVDQRLEGTAATAVWAVQQGGAMIRVHDVPELVRYLRVADAIRAGLSFSIP